MRAAASRGGCGRCRTRRTARTRGRHGAPPRLGRRPSDPRRSPPRQTPASLAGVLGVERREERHVDPALSEDRRRSALRSAPTVRSRAAVSATRSDRGRRPSPSSRLSAPSTASSDVVELCRREADRRVGGAVVETQVSRSRGRGSARRGRAHSAHLPRARTPRGARAPSRRFGEARASATRGRAGRGRSDRSPRSTVSLTPWYTSSHPCSVLSSGGPIPIRSESHQAPRRGCITTSGALQLRRSEERESAMPGCEPLRSRTSDGGRESISRRRARGEERRSCPRARRRSRVARPSGSLRWSPGRRPVRQGRTRYR